MLLLLITIASCFAMYWLPDKVFGFKLRKVDLLADLRIKDKSATLDSLRIQLALSDSLMADSIARIQIKDTLTLQNEADSMAVLLRDSLYNEMLSSWASGDSAGIKIEDFSKGHTALSHFFAALNKGKSLNRPVRVAFLGDSFIEGDILVADFRAELQNHFGGKGVGFVPTASNVAQFRPTVEHKFSGWTTHSLLTDKKHAYTLSCLTFEAQATASVSYKTVNRYANLQPVSRISLIYGNNTSASMQVVTNQTDTVNEVLPFSTAISEYVMDGNYTDVSFTFKEAAGLEVLGVALESHSGVTVDNYSLRGNSGMILQQLDKERCDQFNKIRPYDLIILQYGLNVASSEVLQYGWYRQRMTEVIAYMKICFPEADIMLLGVSDRSHQEDGEFATMPAVLALLHAQRQLAQQTGIAFWNVFAAMGGENSMSRYVKNNWASKDYTHLGFRGGREIANSLLKAILLEKEFYDKAETAAW